MTLNIGDPAPHFSMLDGEGNTHNLSDYKGKKLIIYFYPRDNTPGCTQESCDFRDNFPDFKKLNTAILGVSKDSAKSHQKFTAKYDFPFPLLVDEDTKLCQAFGSWVEKSMYGKKYMGIDRSTFLIDESGKIQHMWRKVKVKNHIAEILDVLNS